MSRALRHRGPDDDGTYLSPTGGLALGARRLSIIDLAEGHQPRSNEDGTVWTAFNGEIYNHPILRERVKMRGHTLRGASDTEILPHLYEDYGERLVNAIEGMFAFAIWDEPQQTLTLARDRFGEKPLFYFHRDGELAFASELTALLAGLRSTPDINPMALDAFFVLGYVPRTCGSILQGIRQLPPGHVLRWQRSTGEIEVKPYWTPPRPIAQLKESPQELAAEARRLLERSIDGRLLSDVPLGVFLSGGVDSTVIAAIAAQRSRSQLKTFTVGYEGGPKDHDERGISRQMAQLIGSDHRDVVLSTEQATARIPKLLAALDQPLADAAVVPLHAVAEFARGDVTVAIGGEGADELFGGYPRYGWLRRSPQRADGHSSSRQPLLGRLAARSTRPRFWRALDLAIPRPLVERHLDWVTAGRRYARAGLYGPRLQDSLATEHVLADLRRDAEDCDSCGVSGTLMRIDQLNWLPDDVLTKADRAGMLASLELRTPYLQRELAEFATSVAPAVHLAKGGKHLLRLLLADLVPEAPSRRKAAFLPPVDSWLRGPLGAVMEHQIQNGSLYGEGWVRRDAALALLAEHRSGRSNRGDVLWPLLAGGLWLDRFRGTEIQP